MSLLRGLRYLTIEIQVTVTSADMPDFMDRTSRRR